LADRCKKETVHERVLKQEGVCCVAAHCQWRKFGCVDPMISVLLVCWFWLNIGLS